MSRAEGPSPNALMAIGLGSVIIGPTIGLLYWHWFPAVLGFAIMIVCAALDVDHDRKKGK